MWFDDPDGDFTATAAIAGFIALVALLSAAAAVTQFYSIQVF